VLLEDFAAFCELLILDSGEALVLEPFQRTMLGDYFDGARETVALLPKGNGKTTLLAALALFELCTISDAEVVIAAASRDQAALMLRQAQGFIRRSADLGARLSVKQREIEHRELGGRVRVLSADVHTGDGVLPSLALVDELHRHRSIELYAVLRDGLYKRGGQMVTISTAGVSHQGPLWVARQNALERGSTRDGSYLVARSDGFVLHEWSVAPDADPDDIEAVKGANPASWITVEGLRERRGSPTTTKHDWRRFAANQWTQNAERWLPEGAWDACADLGRKIPEGERVVIGFDGSRTGDATGIVAVTLGPHPHTQIVALWERDPYDLAWTVPQNEVLDVLRRSCEHWRVEEIAADEAYWVSELEQLAREKLPVVRFPQSGEAMLQATSRTYELIVGGDLTHDGDADLARHVANCSPRRDLQGRVRVNKTSESQKIDLAVATIMAVHRAGQLAVSRPQFHIY
jgi:phage terminase large subunit-like protein